MLLIFKKFLKYSFIEKARQKQIKKKFKKSMNRHFFFAPNLENQQ